MTSKALLVALTALSADAAAVAAHAAAPLLPIEDVKSATAGIEFMDYAGRGQVIKLASHDTLVHLISCEHETITGGMLMRGMEPSDVRDGEVVRTKVCAGGKMRLTRAQASTSAASAFRLQSSDSRTTLFARTPVVQQPEAFVPGDRTLPIVCTDRPGERHEAKIDDAAATRHYDLAKANLSLSGGATYAASISGRSLALEIDKVRSGPALVVSRLLRFQ